MQAARARLGAAQGEGWGGVVIKAIETWYNNYHFRSRLEARWAVFFDTLGVEYRYEMEGYRSEDWKYSYLPDFYLPQLKAWVEIKPLHSDRRGIEKALILASENHEHVIVCEGDCWNSANLRAMLQLNNVSVHHSDERADFWNKCQKHCAQSPVTFALCGSWVLCGHCQKLALVSFNDPLPLFWCLADEWAIEDTGVKSKMFPKQSPRTMEAYAAARSARFEHGETPRVIHG